MGNKWTNEEEAFLRNNYNKLRNSELSNMLNRSYDSVTTHMVNLGLSRPKIWNINRMKYENPMFNEISNKKMKNTIKTKYPNWGNFNIGKKHPKLLKMNLENNPMKNLEIREKAHKKSNETMKKLYAEGKIKSWCKGMSKEEFLSHMPEDFVNKIVTATHTEEAKKKMSIAKIGSK